MKLVYIRRNAILKLSACVISFLLLLYVFVYAPIRKLQEKVPPHLQLRRFYGLVTLQNSPDEHSQTLKANTVLTSYGFNIQEISLGPLGPLKSWEHADMPTGRMGPGENGAEVILYGDEARKAEKISGNYGYSGYVSDKISIHRSVIDTRDRDCITKLYHSNLPDTSIIMPFHNEAMSVLLRSAASILNRSPPKLLREIVFVDDDSSFSELINGTFQKKCAELSPKIKLVRTDKRLGLIQARKVGVDQTSGQTITFLDSHIEVNTNWLPPLLDRIAKNYRTIAQPTVESIDGTTFKYKSAKEGDGLQVGIFDWALNYKRAPIPQCDRRGSSSDPFFTPTQWGGLLTMSRRWYEELGGYDPFLKIWGGEQFELSFKTWMCGGVQEEVPCSRVAHIFRGKLTVMFSPPTAGTDVSNNLARIAEIWMDGEFKEAFFVRRPHLRAAFLGQDLEERRKIRADLHCKSFKWFMENVAFYQLEQFPLVEPEPHAEGKVESKALRGYCLAFNMHNEVVVLKSCAFAQSMTFSWKNDLKVGDKCMDQMNNPKGSTIGIFTCHGNQGNQLFTYESTTGRILHAARADCVTVEKAITPEQSRVVLATCHSTLSDEQTWNIQVVKK